MIIFIYLYYIGKRKKKTKTVKQLAKTKKVDFVFFFAFHIWNWRNPIKLFVYSLCVIFLCGLLFSLINNNWVFIFFLKLPIIGYVSFFLFLFILKRRTLVVRRHKTMFIGLGMFESCNQVQFFFLFFAMRFFWTFKSKLCIRDRGFGFLIRLLFQFV